MTFARQTTSRVAVLDRPVIGLRIDRNALYAVWRPRLPLLLLVGLLLVGLVTIFLRVNDYGISFDEAERDWVGINFLKWYTTFGHATKYMSGFPPAQYQPEHGGVFDGFVSAMQHILPFLDHWYVRHLVTALCGLLGLVVIALCGYELGGGWVAFLAALGLWLYPRYYGAIYNNPKDVPAAVAMTFLLWTTLLLIKRWDASKHPLRDGLLVGVALGIACAVRVNAVIWWAILAVLLAGWWLYNAQDVWRAHRLRSVLIRQASITAVIAVSWMLSMMALWPYVFVSPIGNLINAIQVLSRYPWNGPVLFNGVVYPATQLPWYYAPEWIGIGSPLPLVPLALLGIGIVAVTWIRTRHIDARFAAVIMAGLSPIAAIVILHSVVYDTLRQFLFVIPPLILLAAFGIVRAVTVLARQRQRALRVAAIGLAVLTLGSYLLVALDMISLSPFEYTYFSPIVGGLSGASANFPTDYWATCSAESAEWLAAHYQNYTTSASPVLVGPTSDVRIVEPYLPSSMQVLPSTTKATDSDFYIGYTRGGSAAAYSAYTLIHVVAVEGVTFCVVKANPNTTQPISPGQ